MGSPYSDQQTIQEQFEAFHEANPFVYKLFLHYTIEAGRSGWKHYSINSIFERVRWHIHMETKDDRGFKLNNNFRSRYARLLNDDLTVIAECGEGFFRTRELLAA